jgi:histone H3/H4
MAVDVDVDAVVQMELFFAQLVGDLSTFAKHAGRITVEESDVKLLMDRQRMTVGASGKSLQDLARQ